MNYYSQFEYDNAAEDDDEEDRRWRLRREASEDDYEPELEEPWDGPN